MYQNKYEFKKVLISKHYKLENRAINRSNEHLEQIYIGAGIQKVM